jgi:pimeloyl-ACP methyl ester carboxylesterase
MNRLVTALFAAMLLIMPIPAGAVALPPAPVPAETFDVGMLHVERYGAGKPVVLISGLASGAWTWYGVIPHLAASHTVYVVTLAGFAGRPAPTGDVSIARFEGDLTALLDARHIAKTALVGHSLGGTLSIAYAEAHSDRLTTVVAVDGLPVFPPVSQMSDAQRAAAATQFSGSIRTQTPAAYAAAEQTYMATIGVIDPALAAQTAALQAKSDQQTVAAWAQLDVGSDLRPQLGTITVPLVEITGYTAAEPYSQDQKQAFYSMLLVGTPKAEVIVIPGARHFVMLDQPEHFNAVLDAALAGA